MLPAGLLLLGGAATVPPAGLLLLGGAATVPPAGLLLLGGTATVPPAGLLLLGGAATVPASGRLAFGGNAAAPFAGQVAFCIPPPWGAGLAPTGFLGFATGRGEPQFTQNLPALTFPQLHVHSVRGADTGGGGAAGRGLPQIPQNLPVFTFPQLQVHVPAALLSYSAIVYTPFSTCFSPCNLRCRSQRIISQPIFYILLRKRNPLFYACAGFFCWPSTASKMPSSNTALPAAASSNG